MDRLTQLQDRINRLSVAMLDGVACVMRAPVYSLRYGEQALEDNARVTAKFNERAEENAKHIIRIYKELNILAASLPETTKNDELKRVIPEVDAQNKQLMEEYATVVKEAEALLKQVQQTRKRLIDGIMELRTG
eukprot:Clim_evm9s88 gene=Clim_evmTU9s88